MKFVEAFRAYQTAKNTAPHLRTEEQTKLVSLRLASGFTKDSDNVLASLRQDSSKSRQPIKYNL
jgi:hypothetical protein